MIILNEKEPYETNQEYEKRLKKELEGAQK